MVKMTSSKQVFLNRNSSKGNQLKWYDGQFWYKADYLGYEALSEYCVSHLLKKTSIPAFTEYELLPIEYLNRKYTGCICPHFLEKDQELLTLEKLFRLEKGMDLAEYLAGMEPVERIQYTAEETAALTGLDKFGSYLTQLLEMDAFFLNEDRHLNNIAVIRNTDKSFAYCPVFDNGAALFSDTQISYGTDLPLEKCFAVIEAKPFDRSFDTQTEAAESLYGIHFSYWFTSKDIKEILENAASLYSAQILERVRETLYLQMRKYQYFQKK
ncbi:MAG: hypothetical protein LUF78_06710 [Clostridiales bacterium]|nr:hypothetical protein [Clostridiales bacterium]MCD8154358.1 hypothetical protein [Clostridiales bacterium]